MPVAEPIWEYSEARAEEDVPPESASFRKHGTPIVAGEGPRRTLPPRARAAGSEGHEARRWARKQRAQRRFNEDFCPEALRGYLPLVYKMVQQLSRGLPANVERDDLLAAGVFGLLDSIRRNGGVEGDTFTGYARMRIRGAIVDELRAQDWLSRRARAALNASGTEGTSFVSLNEMTPGEESAHLAHGEDPSEALSAHHERRALTTAIEKLPERERRVVGMYYFEGAKLKEIGAELGVSEPRVSQLHTKALLRLRSMLRAA
ncbi:sigma-70 family RNA polymerase sigma factor [Chondromyces apiculatus]|nr:sigma-70 family RNA polymerase sigma factor [Chondromyces apiculatus]